MRTGKIILILIILAAGFWVVMNFTKSAEHSTASPAKDIYYCPMHPQIIRDHPGECPICNMKLVKKEQSKEKKILYWTDPMIPGYKSDKPGKSPMGMDMVAVYSEQMPVSNTDIPQGYASVSITPQKQQLMGIKTTAVVRKPLVKTVRAFGYVAQSLELYQIQSEFIDAYLAYVNAFRDYNRIRDRRRTWETHRDLQMRLLEAKSKLLKLGLNESHILQLQKIDRWKIWDQPDLLLFEKNSNYWIITQVSESDIGFIDAGQNVEVEIPAYNEKIKGIVRSVAGSIDPESRLVRVLVELTDYKGELIEHMLANVTISVELNESLLVPREAVMDLGTRKVIFIEKEAGIFNPREIEVAWEGSGYWSVKKGLNEGEVVVVDGNFLLDSESRLRASFATATESSSQQGASHVHP